MNVDIEVLFGAFLIVIYGAERLNTPATIRASTTAGRYYAASFVYLLIYLATFYVFTKYPRLVELLNLDGAEVGATGIDPGGSTTVLVAVLLSLLVPKVPVVSDVDARLRRFLHRLAAIPYEAIRLSKEIQHSRYAVPAVSREALIQEMEEQGFPAEALHSEDPTIRRWIGIASLITQLKAWAHSNRFGVFVHERSGQFERINEHYGRLVKMARNAASLEEQARAAPESAALQDAAKAFRHNLHTAQRALLAEICDFISHGVLKTCFRHDCRQRSLREMGFLDVEDESDVGLSVNQTVLLFGLLLALVLANFLLFRPPNAEGERVLLMIAMIVSIYSAAVICAVVPKQYWRLFQYQGHAYPSAGYLLSGIMAVIVSTIISLFFKALVFAGTADAAGGSSLVTAWNHFFSDSYPWLTMAFAAAVSTAFLIDWERPTALPPRYHRIADGVLQAVFLMAAAGLVHWWLTSLSATEGFGGRVPDLGSVLRTTGLVGFTLGFLVPTWYRSSARRGVPEASAAVPGDAQGAEPAPTESAVVKRLHSSH